MNADKARQLSSHYENTDNSERLLARVRATAERGFRSVEFSSSEMTNATQSKFRELGYGVNFSRRSCPKPTDWSATEVVYTVSW